jgi:hypothetical protein
VIKVIKIDGVETEIEINIRIVVNKDHIPELRALIEEILNEYEI